MGADHEAVRRGAVPEGAGLTRSVRAAALAALLTSAGAARADLASDTGDLSRAYAGVGTVTAVSPRFYGGGSSAPLIVPAAALVPTPGVCTTVTVLGAVSTVFALRTLSAASAFTAEEAVPSIAGALSVRRCGAARAHLAEATIDVRSPRAILEILYVEAPETALLPEVRSVLAHRDPGIVAAAMRPGAAPTPASLAERVAGFESQFRREGGSTIERRIVQTGKDGDGRIFLELAPGCHRIAVLGADVPKTMTGFYDIDAQLAWVSGDVAASDRTESPDALLTACAAERTIGVLAFAGSGDGMPVMVVHGSRPLPRGLPERWGPAPRARAARALLDRRIPGPDSPPVYQSLGVAGATSLPIEVERGQCYLAVVAPVQGMGKLVSLSATSGARHSLAHASEPDTAVAVTFCAGNTGRGVLSAEVHGNGVVWVAALFPVARVRLGEEAP